MGSIERNSIWHGNAAADLPGLPRPVEVFVLAVVLTMWDVAAASAATAGALEPPTTQPISGVGIPDDRARVDCSQPRHPWPGEYPGGELHR